MRRPEFVDKIVSWTQSKATKGLIFIREQKAMEPTLDKLRSHAASNNLNLRIGICQGVSKEA
eukprot:12695245-Prorocentrum_lima.AAC.1